MVAGSRGRRPFKEGQMVLTVDAYTLDGEDVRSRKTGLEV